MSVVREDVVRSLNEICGEERVKTDRVERKMYSFDIGAMPSLVKPFVPAGTAGAVVRPKDEAQLVRLVSMAQQKGVALVPRGWATSGYGGVLPKTGAIVVDMSGWQEVLSVDVDRLVVRVQAGAIWEQIDRHIAPHGLALRLYPSSYPSSSAAGWLAQGGSGFGSYEFGGFKDSVVSARVVLPTGEVREFSGDELMTYIADAEGTTGFITEVEFRVRPLEPEVHRLIAFNRITDLSGALSAISAQRLPIWSITFLNPESTRLKKQLPHRHGHPWEEANEHHEPEMPESYLAVIAYPASRRDAVDAALGAIVEMNGGTELDEQAAEHEWEQRFAPMRLKRVGPSIIPTEVVVPLAELGAVLTEIDRKIDQPFILEGMVGKGEKVVLLGFIPHDERSLGFNIAFALSLSVIKIAKAHRGAAYSTGLYFRREAASVLGADRLAALKRFKSANDPKGILNPGKVHGSGGMLDLLMGAASTFEGVVRPLANAAKPPEGPGDLSADVRNIPGDVAFMAYACARCGYCVPTCEQYSGRGWESQSPRGKYAYLREVMAGREKWDRQAIDTQLVCTTCEVCNTRCQLQLPVEHNWMTMRGKLINEEKRGTFPPFEMMAASLRGERDIWAGKAENRDAWVPADVAERIPEQSDILYFAGCTASFVETDIAEASIRLLQDAGYSVGYMGKDEACCGIPMKVAGKWDLFEEIYEHNVAEARKRGAKTIVTSCPACGLVWKELYANLAAQRGEEFEFEVKHYSELVAPALADGRLELKDNPFEGKTVTFHDSCHMGRAQGNYEPPSRHAQGDSRHRHGRDGAQPRRGIVLWVGAHARRRDARGSGSGRSPPSGGRRCRRGHRRGVVPLLPGPTARQQHQERPRAADRRLVADGRAGCRLRHSGDHRVLHVYVELLREVHHLDAAREHGEVHDADLPADDGRDAGRHEADDALHATRSRWSEHDGDDDAHDVPCDGAWNPRQGDARHGERGRGLHRRDACGHGGVDPRPAAQDHGRAHAHLPS